MDISIAPPPPTTTTIFASNINNTNNNNNNNPSTKSPDQESETPPPSNNKTQTPKPLSFSNGFLKRRHNHNHNHNHHIPVVVIYKECLKNHAASLGGHAVDGCGEFMPSPTSTHTDPTSLKCAACGCHRNFHRREHDEHHHSPQPQPPLLPPPLPPTTIEFQPHHRHHPLPPPPPLQNHATRSPNSASPPPISSSYFPSAPHMLLALSGANDPAATNLNPAPGSSPRKRFRTRFTQVQKDNMLEFSERIGWKLQRKDEEIVQEFCNEIKVDRGVLKVWMHNNKNNFGKRDGNGNVASNNPSSSIINVKAVGSTDYNSNNVTSLDQNNSTSSSEDHRNHDQNHNHHRHHENLGSNGSSSS